MNILKGMFERILDETMGGRKIKKKKLMKKKRKSELRNIIKYHAYIRSCLVCG